MKKPAYRSMNFPVYEDMFERYIDKNDLTASYEKGGLNGLEVILAGEPDDRYMTDDMVNGVHLFFHSFWMDFWTGNTDRLQNIFDSEDQWIEYYGGKERESYLSCIKRDLDYAQKVQAEYVVFHVSEVTPEETVTFQSIYTDEQVIDAAIEVINSVLTDDYTFDFLVENLWWAGFNLKDPAMTKRLMDGIHYKRKGILLDTGHAMMNDLSIRTQEAGIASIHRTLAAHEKAGIPITKWIKGIHLHMTLGQECAQKKASEQISYTGIPFYEQFRLSYEHARAIDQHLPVTEESICRLLDRIDPSYVTMEFQPSSREEYEEMIAMQGKILGYI